MISLSLLSKYRSSLMGVAILLIALVHINYHREVGAFQNIVLACEIGVEIFILLSAIGMSFSLSKNPSVKTFYAKRLTRILPAYIIIGLAFEIICYKSLSISIPRFLLISTFWGDRCWWFVGFILLCYLLSPFLYFKTLSSRILIKFVLLSVACLALAFVLPQLGIMLCRFPVFLLGLIIGRMMLDKQELNTKFTLLMYVLTVLMLPILYMYYIPEPYDWMVFMLMVLPFSLLVAKLFDVCHQSIARCFAFVGSISFEFYLLHVYFVLKTIRKYWGDGLWQQVASILVTIVLAYGLHWLLNLVFSRKSKTPASLPQ